MSFRRDLEDLGLLKVVLNTDKTNELLESIQASQAAEVRQREYEASLESKNKLASELEEIDSQIEGIKGQLSALQPCAPELERSVVESSAPLLFVLYTAKSARLAMLHQVCEELLSDDELKKSQEDIGAALKEAVDGSVSVLKSISPKKEGEALDERKSLLWQKQFQVLGEHLLKLISVLASSKEEAYDALEKLRILEKSAIELPVRPYPLSEMKPLCEYIGAAVNGDEEAAKIEVASPRQGKVLDYKNLTGTALVSIPPCSLQVAAGLLAYIHRFLPKTEGEIAEMSPLWVEFQAYCQKLSIRIWANKYDAAEAAKTKEAKFIGATDFGSYVAAKNRAKNRAARGRTIGWLIGFSPIIAIVLSPVLYFIGVGMGVGNKAPNAPEIKDGSSVGKVGAAYSYSASATDPDNNYVMYGWDWNGDGVVDEWTVDGGSGWRTQNPHSWSSPGKYIVKVKAKDSHKAESAWSEGFEVAIHR